MMQWIIGLGLAIVGVVAVAVFTVFRTLPKKQKDCYAFFHPFADGGGGGERVLWCSIQAVQAAVPNARIVIYAREGVEKDALIEDAASRFNVHVSDTIQVVPLKRYRLIQPEHYPRFTLLGQAVGSFLLGWDALRSLNPQVFIDTTGWAFTYPLARLARCKVVCYVHYPTVSSDMLAQVWRLQESFNNDSAISGSMIKSVAKYIYYQAFALVYGLVGAFAHVVMVNSSWTAAHIRQLWWTWDDPLLVYPPVDTTELQKLPLDRRLKQLYLVSVAQFRPEKNHRLQLEAFAMALAGAGNDEAGQQVRASRLKMIGSCRNAADEERLKQLQALAASLDLGGCVDWCVNASFTELKQYLGGAVGGLHSMVDEHFGISVVEYMAAGVIPIAHNSGGPKEDIIGREGGEYETQIVGFLAASVQEYADAITQVLAMDQRDRLTIAAAAQQRARQFSSERFQHSFAAALSKILRLQQPHQHQQ